MLFGVALKAKQWLNFESGFDLLLFIFAGDVKSHTLIRWFWLSKVLIFFPTMLKPAFKLIDFLFPTKVVIKMIELIKIIVS